MIKDFNNYINEDYFSKLSNRKDGGDVRKENLPDLMKKNRKTSLNNIASIYNGISKAITENAKKEIIEFLKNCDNNEIITDNFGEEHDTIYAYLYEGYGMTLVERCVKAIKLADDSSILVLIGKEFDKYEDVSDDDDNWFSLFGGDILGWFTMINILEMIHEYEDD